MAYRLQNVTGWNDFYNDLDNMLIYIDESGDAGFKIQKGSTKHFVVALVIFDDDLDAEETALKIKRYRQEIGKTDKFEFKFNKSSKAGRLSFLECIKSCKFRVRAIIFDKEVIYSSYLRGEKGEYARSKTEPFYSYAVKMVLKNNNDTIKNAKIRLDGLGERQFKKSLNSYLRHSVNGTGKTVIMDFKFRDSRKDVLIQLADMIAGSIKRYYDNDRLDSQDYKKVIKRRIEDEWEFK